MIAGDWNIDGSVFSFPIDLSAEHVSTAFASRLQATFTDKRGTLNTVRNFWYTWSVFGTSKILTVYSDIAQANEVDIEFNEGFNFVS